MLKEILATMRTMWAAIPQPIMVIAKIALTILVYYVLLKIGRKCIHACMTGLAGKDPASSGRKINTLRSIVLSVYKIFLLFIALATIIHFLGLDGAFASIIATAGIGGLAIGFGAQSLIQDCISGFFLLLEDQISVGDFVKINGVEGTVESVQIRVTTIRSFAGELTIIPNGSIKQVTNLSRGPSLAVVEMTIAYEEDIPRAIAVLHREALQWAEENREIVVEDPAEPVVVRLDDSAVAIRVTCRVQMLKHWAAQNAMRARMKMRLDREGIEIPYPHQTVIVRHEEAGGER